MIYKKKWSKSLTEVAILTLYVTLINYLKSIQKRWDMANSVSSKFAMCKESMWHYAQNLCKGHKAADLLILMLDTWLSENLPVAFNEELVNEVASLLKGQSWVQSAEVMQATLDKNLIDLIRADDIATMLYWIKRPLEHGEFTTTRLIQTKVQECFVRVATATYINIKQCIVVAATAASNVNVNRSARGTSALVENLPKVDDDIMNCDEQGPHIFSSNKSLSVLNAVLDSLDLYQSAIKPNEMLSANIALSVLKTIRNESRGANYGVIPRCGQPCPMCGCPCTKGIDHVSSSENDEIPHDTYHQPSGLSGTFWSISNELVGKNCVQCTIDDDTIKLNDDKKFPYKEFNKAFPSWAVPTDQDRLPLREYIFAQYQDELADLYNKPKCPSIPHEYSHDIDDIARRIDRMLIKCNVY
ncbi:hypothetical protein THRCLA_12035 [Thraustotheca clavata]|uniref:Uncharacterized protein n=1 Tax=Thraustotheca clavata TaxID=74557 RepID=A0A1V9Y440_9STRA|nr:hypothetical protein THRCLA_12035 [Thraustotheca clavata]